MKFEQRTVQVLKNFASINNSIMFKKGNKLATISPSKTVMAIADIDETIPGNFAIYDLSRFLGTVSLFQNPELSVHDKFMEISEGSNKFNYTFTDPSLITVPPEKTLKLDDPEIQFELTEVDLQKVMRALSVASLPDIVVAGKDGKILIQAADTKGSTNDVYSVEVGDTDAEFRMIFRSENIKLLPGDYSVAISSKKLANFKGKGIEYWVAVEATSSYNA